MLVGCCSPRTQVRHAAPVVFPVDLDGGEHVYRVHHINVQRKNTDVIPVQNVLTITSHVTSCIVMLKDVIKVSLWQKRLNDSIKNIVSVDYGIQCSLNNFELSATIMTNSSPDHNTSVSKAVQFVLTLVRKKVHHACSTHDNVHRYIEVKIGIHH